MAGEPELSREVIVLELLAVRSLVCARSAPAALEALALFDPPLAHELTRAARARATRAGRRTRDPEPVDRDAGHARHHEGER